MHNLGCKTQWPPTKNPGIFTYDKNPVKSSTVYFTPFHPVFTPFYLTSTKNPLDFYFNKNPVKPWIIGFNILDS